MQTKTDKIFDGLQKLLPEAVDSLRDSARRNGVAVAIDND